jgi:hypothetical protein
LLENFVTDGVCGMHAALAIFGGKRQLPPIMLPKIKLTAAIFCRRRIFVSLMILQFTAFSIRLILPSMNI